MAEMEKGKDTKRITRLSIWAGIFVVVSFLAMYVMPIESAKELFLFFKEIIIHLILGA